MYCEDRRVAIMIVYVTGISSKLWYYLYEAIGAFEFKDHICLKIFFINPFTPKGSPFDE